MKLLVSGEACVFGSAGITYVMNYDYPLISKLLSLLFQDVHYDDDFFFYHNLVPDNCKGIIDLSSFTLLFEGIWMVVAKIINLQE